MINKYIELYNSDNSDIVILTYTNTNCKKINLSIQEKINKTHINAKNPKFNSGDRCVVEFPVKTKKNKNKNKTKNKQKTNKKQPISLFVLWVFKIEYLKKNESVCIIFNISTKYYSYAKSTYFTR
jgi:hypothetical protein